MRIDANMDTRAFESTLQGCEKQQLPFATAKALTSTAKKAQTAIVEAMKTVFDRPTSFTLNSTYVIPATKTKLAAEVKIKDQNQKGLPPTVWLTPQVQGGPRGLKNSERLMRQSGVLPGGMFWVPGAGAKLDSYGNISRGQVVQVLSALRSFPETGYLANQSRRRGARANNNASTFFVGRPNGHGPLGVYQRTSAGHLKPIMIFVTQPNYKPRLAFYDIVHRVYAADFQSEFNKALRDALVLTPFLEAA